MCFFSYSGCYRLLYSLSLSLSLSLSDFQAWHFAGIDERAFSISDCPFHSSYDMASIPAGFVEFIAVRLWRQVSHADYSPTSAAFYSRGAMAQMFVQERTINGLVTFPAPHTMRRSLF
jgi:hypothetical protein